MRFTLSYDGPLRPAGSPAEKMAIRQQLHPQLAELWELEPLSDLRSMLVGPGTMHVGQLDGHDFAAVVHDYHRLRAELDILMSMPGLLG